MSEDESKEKEFVIGPVCAVCGESTDSIYECFVKRELRGRFEMVKIYLCARHFAERLEIDSLPPPPEDNLEETIEDLWNELFGPDNEDENDDDSDDANWGFNKP